jgi:hypothetical protein
MTNLRAPGEKIAKKISTYPLWKCGKTASPGEERFPQSNSWAPVEIRAEKFPVPATRTPQRPEKLRLRALHRAMRTEARAGFCPIARSLASES